MSSQPSWRPNVPKSRLFEEKTWLQGAILLAVAYGVTLALFIQIISVLSTRFKVDIKQNGRVSRQTIYLLIYVCVMFILSTLAMASQAEMIQLSYIENRDFPEGPAAYVELMFSIPINSLGIYCFCLMNWFSSVLLLWRCSIIYRTPKTSVWLIMAIPGLVLLASFVTGAIFLEKISRAPSSSPGSAFAFSSIYTTVAIGLNIVLCLMIIIRLYIHRRHITKLLGRRHAANYTNIISVLIESHAVPFIVALWFLIPFAMRNRLANIPMSFIVQVQAAGSYMIIFRVVKGTAWTSRTADPEFSIPDMPTDVGSISTIRFQAASVEHPARRPVTTRPQNHFPLDGPRDVLDIEPHSGHIVYESPHRDSPGVVEEARPNTFEVCKTGKSVAT